jgi:hypothetical protein
LFVFSRCCAIAERETLAYLQNNKLVGNVELGTYTLELLEELMVNENEGLYLANLNIYQLSNLKILGLGGVDFQNNSTPQVVLIRGQPVTVQCNIFQKQSVAQRQMNQLRRKWE